jgi:hypothetical protein
MFAPTNRLRLGRGITREGDDVLELVTPELQGFTLEIREKSS